MPKSHKFLTQRTETDLFEPARQASSVDLLLLGVCVVHSTVDLPRGVWGTYLERFAQTIDVDVVIAGILPFCLPGTARKRTASP